MKTKRPGITRHDIDMMVPIEPFRDWVEGLLESYDKGLLAEKLGLTQRSLWEIRFRKKKVSTDLVDRALTTFNGPLMLVDLYPEAYDFGEDE